MRTFVAEGHTTMEKWADYCISAVQFNADGTHINKVKIREDLGEKLGKEIECTRAQIVQAIADGTTFVTVVRDRKTGEWEYGAPVTTVTLKTVFLKTESDSTTADNLDNLPTF